MNPVPNWSSCESGKLIRQPHKNRNVSVVSDQTPRTYLRTGGGNVIYRLTWDSRQVKTFSHKYSEPRRQQEQQRQHVSERRYLNEIKEPGLKKKAQLQYKLMLNNPKVCIYALNSSVNDIV